MSVVLKPSDAEEHYTALYALDSMRPGYYTAVVMLAKGFFNSLGFEDEVQNLDRLITFGIEKWLGMSFNKVLSFYDNPRFFNTKKAYIRVGDVIDGKNVTKEEIGERLAMLKDYIFMRVNSLSIFVRKTRYINMVT